MEPLFQLGKGGMSDALIKQVDDALEAREVFAVSQRSADDCHARSRRYDRRKPAGMRWADACVYNIYVIYCLHPAKGEEWKTSRLFSIVS